MPVSPQGSLPTPAFFPTAPLVPLFPNHAPHHPVTAAPAANAAPAAPTASLVPMRYRRPRAGPRPSVRPTAGIIWRCAARSAATSSNSEDESPLCPGADDPAGNTSKDSAAEPSDNRAKPARSASPKGGKKQAKDDKKDGSKRRARVARRPRSSRSANPDDQWNEEDWLVRSRIRRSPALAAKTKVVVCGGGSFGTAMANLLARNGYPVSLLVRKSWVCDEINLEHRNPKYLPEFLLPENLTATVDPEEAFRDAKLCVHAVPVQATRAFVDSIRPHYPDDLPVLCTSKGLEISSHCLMCELLPQLLDRSRKYAYLSGPSFAQEIMQGLPTAVVVASSDRAFANSLADMFSAPSFKVFTSTDTVGLEVAGAIKNVIAIAAGMSDGLGLGTNSMAALVTRGCSEMRRIAIAQGASPVTLAGLSGVGDTFLTCFGPLSRNRTVGVRLGRGEKLEDILSTSRQIAEGVATARALVEWLGDGAEKNSPAYLRARLKFPILYGVAAILDGEITPREGLHMLLAMPPRPED